MYMFGRWRVNWKIIIGKDTIGANYLTPNSLTQLFKKSFLTKLPRIDIGKIILEIMRVRLTHWGWVTHICVSKLSILGSDNGLSPGRRQAIIWTNAGILFNWTLGTHFSEILSEIHIFSFKQMRLKMSPGKWRPYCLGLDMLGQDMYPGSLNGPPMVEGWVVRLSSG